MDKATAKRQDQADLVNQLELVNPGEDCLDSQDMSDIWDEGYGEDGELELV